MKAIEKALWYIENNYREQVSLDVLAQVAGVSRFHLSRIFCYAIGQPISRYIRMRRLSTAAIALAAGEADILDLALSLGYGSHEAFSRAFKQHFCLTPEQIRAQGHTQNLNLTEAISMQNSAAKTLQPPRLETLPEITLVGSSRHYTFDKVGEIPNQWQSFAPMIHTVTNAAHTDTYGVIYNNADDSFDYLAAVELSTGAKPPADMVSLTLKPQAYLVFQHDDHVAALRDTCDAIWSDWLPASEHTAVAAPWFERYGASFQPHTGAGGLEVWIPVEQP